MNTNLDQQFLDYVIKALVDNPDDVKINRTVDEMGVLMTLEVNAADMGKVIGVLKQHPDAALIDFGAVSKLVQAKLP